MREKKRKQTNNETLMKNKKNSVEIQTNRVHWQRTDRSYFYQITERLNKLDRQNPCLKLCILGLLQNYIKINNGNLNWKTRNVSNYLETIENFIKYVSDICYRYYMVKYVIDNTSYISDYHEFFKTTMLSLRYIKS